jgi:hypothetical protein
MKYTFIVTSAVNSKFGKFSPAERLIDTEKTIQSVQEKAPEADIVLVDMCGDPLTEDQKKRLAAQVTEIVDYSGVPDVQAIYQIPNHDIVKNLTEMLCFESLLRSKNWKKYDRVFKISGRYQLTDKFNIDDYKTMGTRIVFSGIHKSQFDPAVTGNPPEDNFQFMSRLWSFPTSLINEITDAYSAMVKNMVERINSGGYIDIEHLLYKHMPINNISFKIPIGLTGGIAPNGMVVND